MMKIVNIRMMKIINCISKALSLCSGFSALCEIVFIRAYNCLKPNCFSSLKPPAIPKSPVRYGICLFFKYASDFIWMLGKNNLDSLVVCRALPTADTNCCNCAANGSHSNLLVTSARFE
jgi:hypothetical protein